MKKIIITLMFIVSCITFLTPKAMAEQCVKLSDSELDQITAGNFMEMVDYIVEQAEFLATASDLVEINAVNSATSVWSNMSCNVEEVTYSREDTVINQIGNPTNILTIGDSAQSSLSALVNINAVNSATCVQSNFNFNAQSVTNINQATVINTH